MDKPTVPKIGTILIKVLITRGTVVRFFTSMYSHMRIPGKPGLKYLLAVLAGSAPENRRRHAWKCREQLSLQ